TAMRSVLFLAFPATVGLILLGEPVVSIFERGEWGEQSTQATAWALGFFALGIAGHSLLEVLSRAFYALADTWTPVKVGVAAMLGNILLSVILIQIIGQPDSLVRGPFAGLALANSLATLIESAILWWLLTRRVSGIHDRYILQGAGRALAASLLMGGVVWLITLIELPKLVHLILGTSAGVITFFGLAIMMRLDEVAIITRRVFRRS
ncbi:MAG: murein biosynthesis integral membrane protein MurJ, partial [Chloroflexi bacterium]